VRHQWLGELSYTEALHVGRIGLWQALVGFDPSRATAFSTYAVVAIRRALWRAVAQARRHPHEVLTPHPLQLARHLGLSSGQALEAVAEDILVHQALYVLVAQLPHRLRYVVARYGLAGDLPQT